MEQGEKENFNILANAGNKRDWKSFKELNSIFLFSSSRIIKSSSVIILLYWFVDIE